MNIMRKIFLTVLLVAFASAAFAEGTPKKPSVAGFVSNGFWDNWEVSAGFGPIAGRMVQQFRFPDRQDDVAVHVRTLGFHG